jgi:stage III sporulation protein AD
MEVYLQASGGILIALIMILMLGNQSKQTGVLLAIGVSAMVLYAAGVYLEPIIAFVKDLEKIGNLDDTMVRPLLKISGICLISQICTMICGDCGSASLGKALQLLSNIVILWLALPFFQGLLELIQKILGEL